MPTKHVAVDVSELPEGQGKTVEVAGRALALFNVGGKFFALDNTCPHRGGPLGDGPLMGATVTCPWHGWQFDCTTGKSTRNPAVGVACIPTSVEGSTVYVEL
jgi:nitrite reductase (NADH) small subunit/3-phenylpropionate/trans-cinnamate dioxygenase ferredoxin subunit